MSATATASEPATKGRTVERGGNGVLIRSDGLVLTIGYLVTEAETIWITAADGRAVPGHALAIEREPLDEFLEEQVARAKADGVLFSAHLKATMMKVSDPILFGHAVEAYLAEHPDARSALRAAGIDDDRQGRNFLRVFELADEIERGQRQQHAAREVGGRRVDHHRPHHRGRGGSLPGHAQARAQDHRRARRR